ncbi:MAG: hypothetical protein ACI9U2_005229 [Bradymonadia bacterium]
MTVPEGWTLLPPGDAGVTRRVKAGGPHWVVQEKRGRRMFSQGIWAPTARIEVAQRAMQRQRQSPAHQRKLAQARIRREREQAAYVRSFTAQVKAFLAFHERHADLAEKTAHAIAVHATPVGSGTVARTKRIPVAERAEAAVIAWLRHQTTAYDSMRIARVKGLRREVRRELAARSRRLLDLYRADAPVPDPCLLTAALTAALDPVPDPVPDPVLDPVLDPTNAPT